MLVSFQSNLDKFHTADFTVVEDTRQISAAARIVNPLNNINHVDPGGESKQWITVLLDNGQLGTIILTGNTQLHVQPGDVVNVLLAKRGAFGRAQQTLVYIKNIDTEQEIFLPASTVLAEKSCGYINCTSSTIGILATLPGFHHLFSSGEPNPISIAGSIIGSFIVFALAYKAASYLIKTGVKVRREKHFYSNEVEEAIEYFRLNER